MTLEDITTVLKNPAAIESYSVDAISALSKLNPNMPQIRAILLRKRMLSGAEFEVDFTETNYFYGNSHQFVSDVFPIDKKDSSRFITESFQQNAPDKEEEKVSMSSDSLSQSTPVTAGIAASSVAASGIVVSSVAASGIIGQDIEPIKKPEALDDIQKEKGTADMAVVAEDSGLEPKDIREVDDKPEMAVEKESTDVVEAKAIEEGNSLVERIEASPYANWLLGLKQQVPTTEIEHEDAAKEIAQTEINKKDILDQNETSEASSGTIKADESSVLKQEIASPSLADLLAKQGHHKKAIGMYEKLSLIFPEKRAYFAAQIKKIKGK